MLYHGCSSVLVWRGSRGTLVKREVAMKEMKRERYVVDAFILERVLIALEGHLFSEDGESNNDTVWEAKEMLEDAIQVQDKED